MGTFIRRLLVLLTGSVIVVAACYSALAAPGAATEITSRSASIGSKLIPYIFDIVPDPFEQGSVLLATQAGLYRAGHDGSAERVSYAQNPLQSLSVAGANGSRLFARGIADNGRSEPILVSEDKGRSWRGLAATGERPSYSRTVEAGKANPDVIYAAGHSFWRSTDAGQHWALAGAPPDRILDLAASASDPARIFAATFSDLYVSEDSGTSWRPTGGARCRQPVMAVDTGTDGTVYAFSLCTGLIRGDERTGGWEVVNNRFGGCIVQHLAVDPRDSSQIYAVIRCHKVLVSADGGATWRELGSQEPWKPTCVTDPVGRIDADN